MKHILFRCHLTQFDPSVLETLRLENPYSIEDPQTGELLIGGWIDPCTPIPSPLPHVHLIELSDDIPIDWEKQWASFAPNVQEGIAHIDLSRFGQPSPLLLKPGCGFGDLSHPTTQLSLELLAPRVLDKTLIDIGCGSGILSLAGLKLGAKAAYGIDIDPGALEHAQENAELNQLTAYWSSSLEIEPIPQPLLVVMNMIQAEQLVAWTSQPSWLRTQDLQIVTSGMLSSQRDGYLEMVNGWGWECTEELKEGEWASMVFHQKFHPTSLKWSKTIDR